jgi:hypothetical protein
MGTEGSVKEITGKIPLNCDSIDYRLYFFFSFLPNLLSLL